MEWIDWMEAEKYIFDDVVRQRVNWAAGGSGAPGVARRRAVPSRSNTWKGLAEENVQRVKTPNMHVLKVFIEYVNINTLIFIRHPLNVVRRSAIPSRPPTVMSLWPCRENLWQEGFQKENKWSVSVALTWGFQLSLLIELVDARVDDTQVRLAGLASGQEITPLGRIKELQQNNVHIDGPPGLYVDILSQQQDEASYGQAQDADAAPEVNDEEVLPQSGHGVDHYFADPDGENAHYVGTECVEAGVWEEGIRLNLEG